MRYSTVDQLLSSRAVPRPSCYNDYRHALLHGRTVTITIVTRYSTAELLQSLSSRATPRPNYYHRYRHNHYRHALLHGRTITITIATITVVTRYSTAELLQSVLPQSPSPRATPRPRYCYSYHHTLLHGLFTLHLSYC